MDQPVRWTAMTLSVTVAVGEGCAEVVSSRVHPVGDTGGRGGRRDAVEGGPCHVHSGDVPALGGEPEGVAAVPAPQPTT
ncbi:MULTISPECIES: hypothetical protein [unclassified Streptomyces]|uniref:hypothetical protein n=1 Tax=unclassified Streptomyces TaxID=2593676 RepID=UPI0036B67F5D